MSVPQSTESALEVVRPTPLPTPIRGPRLGLPTKDELDALMAYGNVIVKSGMAPDHIKTAEAAIVAMRYGHQLGIDEFTALQNMYIQNGKPTALASLLHSLILRDHGGDAIQIAESSAERCVLRCRRRDSSLVTEISYTIEEAKAAGLLEKKGPWQQYRQDMLFARCISRAGRMLYRDSTLGMYTPEELGSGYIEVQGEVIDVSAGERPSDEHPSASNRLANLHRIGEERSLDHEALHRIAVFKRGHGLGDLTDSMLRDFERMVEQAADTDLATWSTDWHGEIERAERDGAKAFLRLTDAMKAAGVNQKDHREIVLAYKAASDRLGPAAKDPPATEPIEVPSTELPGMPADNARYTS